MTKPDFPQGICAGMRLTKPLAETAFDGLVMVSKTFIGVVAGVALVLSAWLLVILWTAPNEDGGAPSTSVVYPPDPPQPGEPLDRQAVGRAGELGINLVSAGQEKREL
jgi:hypothetical protein